MVEVEHAPLRGVQFAPMRGVVEVLHRALDFGFDLRVLRLVIERAVLKDDVFPFGHVHELERRGDVAGVIGGQTNAVSLRQRDAPAANAPGRFVDVRHQLPGGCVALVAAEMIEAAGDALQQAADGRPVLPRNLKPKLENRDGAVIVRSRCGLETACRFIEDVTAADAQGYGCVIIDEAQFLTKAQVEMLVEMVDDYDVPVIAYGLRADFQNNFFEGSQWLMAWADTIEEIKTICWCGRKATCNARVVDGRVVQEGEQVVLGGNGQYVSLCRKHFRRGELGDFKDLHLGED